MTGIGAILGLILGIILIIRKYNPAYSLMFAALVGGLLGGTDLSVVVTQMTDGVRDMCPAIVRILAAGVLAGALVQTGSAEKIADGIIRALGSRCVLASLTLAVFLLTFSGVFIDVAVITAAPVALAVGAKMQLSRSAVLLAMIGGGKSGNIISPNPNTIAAAEKFGADLSSVMFTNLIPACVGVFFTIFLAWLISRRGTLLMPDTENRTDNNPEIKSETPALPHIAAALLGPLCTITLLALRPLAGIAVDPFIALPAGGLVCIAATCSFRKFRVSLEYGLSKMSGVAVLLIGTGTLAGVLKNSTLKEMLLSFLSWLNLPAVSVAPISGALMSGATASTTAGATVAAASFSDVILAAGVSAVSAAAMINAGATVLDNLPHGSFFHATAGAVQMPLSERLKLIPLETAVGFVLALTAAL